MAKIATVPIASLVEDMSIYPRHAVDDSNVQSLALALESGCDLPPVIADEKSKRIVDGWHRVRAYKRVYGSGAAVPCELRKYASEAELIEDAIRLNASHGRRLDVMDQTRAILMLEQHGISPERIALSLHVTEKRVEKLRIRVARSNAPTNASVPGTKQVTLKRSVSHMAGKTLTKEQAKAHESMPGTSFLLIARQLRVGIETKLVNMDDPKIAEELVRLHDVLSANLVEA